MSRRSGQKGTIYIPAIVDQPRMIETDKFWHVTPGKRHASVSLSSSSSTMFRCTLDHEGDEEEQANLRFS
ncbi:hypothetical protein ANTPLA_LOCUS9097 [Anthophora plagiata]